MWWRNTFLLHDPFRQLPVDLHGSLEQQKSAAIFGDVKRVQIKPATGILLLSRIKIVTNGKFTIVDVHETGVI